MACLESAVELGCVTGACERPSRLGIMGGTFDPVHMGHLTCAQAALEACGLDAVVFVPAGNPNFKRDRRLAPAEDRLAWCRLAVADQPHFMVSDIEIAREGVTYTIDTLRELRSSLSDDVELFFIVGADSAASLPRWRESSELSKLATFVAVSRPGHQLDSKMRGMLAQEGFRMTYVEGPACDVSSSDIRDSLIVGKSVRGLVPESVRELIEQCPSYREEVVPGFADSCVAERGSREGLVSRDDVDSRDDAPAEHGSIIDPLSDAFYDALRAELLNRVSERRFCHTEGVAKAASELARVYGVDERKARLAGLLHDWDKGYDDEQIRARVGEVGLSDRIDPWVVANLPQVLHAHTAAAALARDFPQIPADVIQAIDRHTTAAPDMSPLDMVLNVADAIEEGRRYGRVGDLRALVGEVELDELFFLTYEYWVLLLFERRKMLHPDTITIWNELVARRATGKGGDHDR